MKELARMWKYGQMVALTVLCAGVYMLFLLPTKSLALIPGITEIRPASLLPVLFGLLFGPAGAFGSAAGNLLGDFFGTLSPASAFGFIGNFMYAYIPYKLWYGIEPKHGEDKTPTVNSAWKLALFGITVFISSAGCAAIIAWGANIMNLASFSAISIIISLHNSVITMAMGPIALPALYSAAKKHRLLWTDIMHPKDIGKAKSSRTHPILVSVGAVGGLVSGLAAEYLAAGQAITGQNATTTGPENIVTALAVLPFLAILFYGSFNS